MRRHPLPVLIGLALASCATGPTPSDPATEPTDAVETDRPNEADESPKPERSVRPGVNDRYFNDDNAAETFTEMFEREGREVFAHRATIIEAIEARSEPPRAIADIGAGTGVFTLELAAIAGDGGSVKAVDIVPQFLELLREETKDAANVEVVQADVKDVGLAADSVDVVFMSDVYHHIEYPVTYMRSVRKALRPGGKLFLIDFQRIEGVTSERMLKHVRADKDTVIGELEQAGFTLAEEVEFDGLDENYFLVLE